MALIGAEPPPPIHGGGRQGEYMLTVEEPPEMGRRQHPASPPPAVDFELPHDGSTAASTVQRTSQRPVAGGTAPQGQSAAAARSLERVGGPVDDSDLPLATASPGSAGASRCPEQLEPPHLPVAVTSGGQGVMDPLLPSAREACVTAMSSHDLTYIDAVRAAIRRTPQIEIYYTRALRHRACTSLVM
eukprot:COSAG05_NODE_1834_length_3997_cov_127.609131_6_plen_187_part_00